MWTLVQIVALTAVIIVGIRQLWRMRVPPTRFASLGELGARVDLAQLRQIREEQGEVHAVKALREQVLELGPAEAVRWVREL